MTQFSYSLSSQKGNEYWDLKTHGKRRNKIKVNGRDQKKTSGYKSRVKS